MEECAADPLAGGVVSTGHQCGMLWGATLAAGAEAWRRHPDLERAAGTAVETSRLLAASFERESGSLDCADIARVDFRKRFGLVKYVLTGGIGRCFGLADRWAPEAIRTAAAGLEGGNGVVAAWSCASEAARRMGATPRQQVMVAGFAGGLGLSGHGCGALGAAVWLNTLRWIERQRGPVKSAFDNPEAKRTLEVFQEAAGTELRCERIAGRRFASVDEHTAFVRSGGCEKVIAAAAGSALRG